MIKTRVQLALTQLRETHEPIKAIAATLGFYDAAHLAHTVHRVTGAPPRRHRERWRFELRPAVATTQAAERASLSHHEAHGDATTWVRAGWPTRKNTNTSVGSCPPSERRPH
jgi:AraC-like DNA-binding protein